MNSGNFPGITVNDLKDNKKSNHNRTNSSRQDSQVRPCLATSYGASSQVHKELDIYKQFENIFDLNIDDQDGNKQVLSFS